MKDLGWLEMRAKRADDYRGGSLLSSPFLIQYINASARWLRGVKLGFWLSIDLGVASRCHGFAVSSLVFGF